MHKHARWTVLIALLLVVSSALGGASGQALAGSAPDALPEGVLWDQPLSTANLAAYSNQSFPDYQAYDTFLADDFVNGVAWDISTIFVPGRMFYAETSLLNAQALTWQIYADNGGVPAGDPWDVPPTAFWTLTLLPTDGQVQIDNGTGGMPSNTTLSLATPVTLQPGHWWLVFYPTMSINPHGQYGRQAADTQNGHVGKLINPGNVWGCGTAWVDWTTCNGPTIQRDFAFRLEGVEVTPAEPDIEVSPVELVAQQCTNRVTVSTLSICNVGTGSLTWSLSETASWLSAAPASGTVTAPGCQEVAITLDSTGLAAGSYTGSLFINSSDLDEPTVQVPVQLTVAQCMHIASITGRLQPNRPGGKSTLVADVAVHDGNHALLGKVVVTATITAPGESNSTTVAEVTKSSNGTAHFRWSAVAPEGFWTFCVDDLDLAGFTYARDADEVVPACVSLASFY